MNTTTKKSKTAIFLAGLLVIGAAQAVFALDVNTGASAKAQVGSTTVKTKVSAAITARIEKGKTRAKEEIERRTAALNTLGEKVQAMARVTSDVKNSIAVTIQSQVSALQTLQAKIETDTDIDTLKTDIKSITESYRIFMLVLPQGRIAMAADSIQITAASLTTLSGKLASRINDEQAKGSDVVKLNTDLTEMNAKIVDAKAQAEAAISLTATLKPDNGDRSIADANKKALKDAQAKLKTAREDLKAARKFGGDIAKTLRKMNVQATATTTVSATTTTQ